MDLRQLRYFVAVAEGLHFSRASARLSLIGRGEGIDTAPAIISRYFSFPEVAFVPLVDAAPAVLVLARRRDNENRLIDGFVAPAREIAATAVLSDTPCSEPLGEDPRH